MNKQRKNDFLPFLESLRGVAALMVAIGHSLIIFPVGGYNRIWEDSILSITSIYGIIIKVLLIVFNGGLGVIIFFVLSGYVLGLSMNKRELSIKGIIIFYVQRLFRIYPVHWVWIIFIVIVLLPISSSDIFSVPDYFGGWNAMFSSWHHKIEAADVFQNIVLHKTNLNNLAWTLRIELVMSLLFPVLYYINRYLKTYINIFVLIILLFISFSSYKSNCLIGFYLMIFNLGIVFSNNNERFTNILEIFTHKYLTNMLVFALYILSVYSFSFNPCFQLFLSGIIIGLIIINLSKEDHSSLLHYMLQLRFLRYLGKISYSFYVMHLFVLFLISKISFLLLGQTFIELYSSFLMIAIALFSIGVTVGIANIAYKKIEMKFVILGRNILMKNLVTTNPQQGLIRTKV